MTTITTACINPNCTTSFEARQTDLDRGHAKYCSRKCFGEHRTILNNAKPPKLPNLTCDYCGTNFYRNPSKLRNSKHGFKFCNRKCKELAQSDEQFKIMAPDHYHTANGKYDYRKRALKLYGCQCALCQYDDFEDVLHVHHIDKNRNNNVVENLIVLCPTCHVEVHRGHKVIGQ